MTEQRIEPHRVTKPIQLLAAWLVGLILTNGIFLAAAMKLDAGTWERGALVLSAILNVPIFLVALFVLQTRFRAELQEDSYYSTYLNQKTNQIVTVEKDIVRTEHILKRLDSLESRAMSAAVESPSVESSADIRTILFGVNKNLPEREQVKRKLAERGLIRATSFGSDDLPEYRVVSVSRSLSADALAHVLQFVSELGFHHYKLYDTEVDEPEEDVLIGSYGEPEFEILSGLPNKSMQATGEDARA